MVLISYVIILLGMLINNPQILRFGFIIFILAIIIEFLAINIIAQNDAELAQLNQFIKDCHVIEPFEENIDYINIMLILPIARLPFSFIMYFR